MRALVKQNGEKKKRFGGIVRKKKETAKIFRISSQ
jgi:hypothetical protein